MSSSRGAEENFVGHVWLDDSDIAQPGVRALRVSFEPGARTNWHSHSEGQVLYILTGRGCVQAEGGGIEAVGSGDIVYAPPGEVHWHGAAPDSLMTHIAISPTQGGQGTTWLGPVTEEEYRSGLRAGG